MCSAAPAPRVDFSYAFATPHRVTAGPPTCSDRTLLDLQPGYLRMAWTYDDLTHYPLAAFKTPVTAWDLHIQPEVDGHVYATSKWTRPDSWIPGVVNTYEDPAGFLSMEVLGGPTAAVARLTLRNPDTRAHRYAIRIDSASWGENPAWLDAARWTGDHMTAGWNERADRVLVLGIGAKAWSLQPNGIPPGARTMVMVWDIPAGGSADGWIVRPYRAVSADLPALRARNWQTEMDAAKRVWTDLIARSAKIELPDTGMVNAFKACLADLFIMREPVANGYIAGVPGTECYRAPNSGEASIVAIALDQLGYHRESEAGYRLCIESQEPDGNWADMRGWCHSMWVVCGMKAWAIMEHYRQTGDRKYLERAFPRLLANSRFLNRERERTRIETGGAKPITYGLLPRGFGDCGLMNDTDMYGVFFPHNIWAVYSDREALEAARILGKEAEARELQSIFENGLRDLRAALDRGAIAVNGYRWIPGTPGKTSGSRWGALNALFPCGLLDPHDPLIDGTLRKIESNLSPGGIPVGTGWLLDGMWVAIALDNVAEAHLVRDEGDAAAAYLYATINHATPLVTWCEERGQEAGSSKCTGDRQHLWTPVAVVRCLRDCLVMEDGDTLHIARGTDRSWLAGGAPVGIHGASTHFGTVSWTMQQDGGTVTGQVDLARGRAPQSVVVHVRMAEGRKLSSVRGEKGERLELLPGAEGFRWLSPRGWLKFTAEVTR